MPQDASTPASERLTITETADLTITETAELIGDTYQNTLNRGLRGEFELVRVGKRRFISVGSVLRYLERCGEGAAA